jgi:hypothetical protein
MKEFDIIDFFTESETPFYIFAVIGPASLHGYVASYQIANLIAGAADYARLNYNKGERIIEKRR